MIFRDTPKTAFFKVVEAILDERPEDWRSDHYRLTNSGAGVSIWIANAAYGLRIECGGARIDPSFWWKRRLRRAVDKCLSAQAVSALKLHMNRVRKAVDA